MPTATRPPQTTLSADGTTIAFDVYPPDAGDAGTTPLVVLVGGATNRRLDSTGLAEALAAVGCTAVVHDRRGRGDSTDTAPYAVEREIEDVAAVVDAVRPGRSAVVVGFSSGAALALRVAAHGAPVAKVVAFEPPYRTDAAPPLPGDYTTRLEEFNAAGDRDGAFAYFHTAALGVPAGAVAGLRQQPFWAHFAETAATLAYDGHCLGGDAHPVPVELAAALDVDLLALASTGSPPWLQEPARQVGDLAPRGSFELVEGEFHTAQDEVLAARIRAFALD